MALIPFFNGSHIEYREDGAESHAEHSPPPVQPDIAARFGPVPGVDPRVRPIRAEDLLGPPASAEIAAVQKAVTQGARSNPDAIWSQPAGDHNPWQAKPAPQAGFRRRT